MKFIILLIASASLSVGAFEGKSSIGLPLISRAQATRIAVEAVPFGRISTAALEVEDGRMVYSFDIKQPGSDAITEIHVDAETGVVISRTQESAAEEASEAMAPQGVARARPSGS